jgi:hypothetical protein
MKITILIFAILAFANFASAQTSQIATQKPIPKDFVSDGCTSFPDGNYYDCCFAHDVDYHYGGSWKERWQSDKRLYKCVAAKKGVQHKFIAPLMWLGVRAFGPSWIPTKARWGFGKTKKVKNKP